jgi:hypothetical protein
MPETPDRPTHGCMECKRQQPYSIEEFPNGNTGWRCTPSTPKTIPPSRSLTPCPVPGRSLPRVSLWPLANNGTAAPLQRNSKNMPGSRR